MAPAKIDDDPVEKEYDIYITPDLAEHIYLLQYPIRKRSEAYNERKHARPSEMRIKPKSGFLEMDIPLSTEAHFNKHQGLRWGNAVQKADASGVTTFGAAAGFGPGNMQRRGRGGETLDEYGDGSLENFDESVQRKQVHNKQTLGGQILKNEDGKPNYMLGTFRGDQLHLTRIDGIAQMRPQFHHIDAMSHLEKSSTQRETEEARPAPQARATLQSYKNSGDTKDARAAKEKGLFQLAQEETWKKMTYFDEDDDESYDTYNEKFFVGDTPQASRLESTMTNEEYLDAISAPRRDPSGRRKKRPLTRKQRTEIELSEDEVEHPEQQEDGNVE